MIKLPSWLINLPPGLYTVKDLEKISNTGQVNIYLRMKKLGICFKRIKQIGSKPRIVKVYMWLGSDYYNNKGINFNGKEKI